MRRKFSIIWKVYFYLVGFTGLLLLLIWFLQIAHLNSFYKNIKTNDLNKAAKKMLEEIDSDDMETSMLDIADKYDIGINLLNSDGESICNANVMNASLISVINEMQYKEYYNKAKNNNGTVIYEVDGRFRNMSFPTPDKKPEDTSMSEDEEESETEVEAEPETGKQNSSGSIGMQEINQEQYSWFEQKRLSESSDSKSLIYAHIITTDDGDEELLLMSVLITPVDATVSTLKRQFIYISIIFIVLAAAIAFVISKIVAKPIVKISASAKKLAKGDYDVTFEPGGYKEVGELADTLNYASGELKRTEDLRRELIANVSHDLRTPLTMITAYAEVMRDLPGENNPENVQVIIDEAKRLTTLVNDMLDLSKLQAGALEIKPEEFDFTTNILAVMNRFAKLKEQDGYNISFEYDSNVKVIADEYKIYQVVYNLIINAINYAGDDKTVIVRQIEKENTVRLEIEDHGEGIAEEEKKNIWDRYYKIDKVHKRAVQGTGLGLSIVYNILKLHKAEFGVESEKGKGSTFWFEIKKVV